MTPVGNKDHDYDFVTRLLLRDEKVLADMEQSYGKMLLSLTGRILGSAEAGKECVNDTLLSAWEHIPPEKPENLAAYLAVTCRRKCFDLLRRERRIKRGSGSTLYLLSDYEEILVSTEGPENALEAQELAKIINAFLQKQEHKRRMLFIGRYYDNRSAKELSAQWGLTVSAVNKALSAMKRSLAEELKREGYTI